mmetsp:Transcript_6495/g.17648  ORF Transcript_6495/g.17648 Transcript_6495/m.17648 type:complete len:211 (-) Transcript_6495:109-741(-)
MLQRRTAEHHRVLGQAICVLQIAEGIRPVHDKQICIARRPEEHAHRPVRARKDARTHLTPTRAWLMAGCAIGPRTLHGDGIGFTRGPRLVHHHHGIGSAHFCELHVELVCLLRPGERVHPLAAASKRTHSEGNVQLLHAPLTQAAPRVGGGDREVTDLVPPAARRGSTSPGRACADEERHAPRRAARPDGRVPHPPAGGRSGGSTGSNMT